MAIPRFSYAEFQFALSAGLRLTGEVEGVGYVYWIANPRMSPTPQTSHWATYAERTSFVVEDYIMVVKPFPKAELREQDVKRWLVSKTTNGSVSVNKGATYGGIKTYSSNAKVDIRIDEMNKRLEIRISDVGVENAAIKGTNETVSYSFDQLGQQYPEMINAILNGNPNQSSVAEMFDRAQGRGTFGKTEITSPSQSSTDYYKQTLEYGNKGFVVGGVMTYSAEKYWQRIERFRPVVDGRGNTVYRGYGKWPQALSPKGGNALRTVSRVAKPLGAIGSVVTLGTGGYGLYKYSQDPNHPHAVHPVKFTTDVIFVALSFTNPVGIVCSFIYFGVDAFVPGGWERLFSGPMGIIPQYKDIHGTGLPVDNTYVAKPLIFYY
jgi:hypothetical protein